MSSRDSTKRPTMVDVAQLAGVSHQTVARVLNGSIHVDPKTRSLVEDAILKLRYRKNPTARALATRRTMNLGVVSFGLSLYGPSLSLFGVVEAARQNGYATTLSALKNVNKDSMRSALEHLAHSPVDGIICLAPYQGIADMLQEQAPDVPLVAFEPGVVAGTRSVAFDEVLGARLATRHLLGQGHDSVWHVSGSAGWLGTDTRIRGWQAELSEAGKVAHRIIEGDWTARSGYEAGKFISTDRRITAVFVANDQMALGVIRALIEEGVRVPEDVSVVGCDDVPEAAYYRPSLTTVRLDFNDLGRRCLQQVVGLIEGEPQPMPLLQPDLIVRDSSHAGCLA
jgi:DNA-binding LacI/PurR family transcriptional regulator